jgi:hypothetical protein
MPMPTAIRRRRLIRRAAVTLCLLAGAFGLVPHLSPRLLPPKPAMTQTASASGAQVTYLPALLRGAQVSDLPVAPTVPPVSPTPVSPTPVSPTPPASPTATTAATSAATPSPVASPPATAAPTQPPSPTAPPPTEPPSATPAPPEPSPTAKPPPALACRELLSNGDFERGARSWALTVTTTEQPISLAILHRSGSTIGPYQGDWIAYLGGLDATFFGLTSDRLAQIDAAAVVSATLSYRAALLTEERRDGRANDKVSVFLTAGRRAEVKAAAVSEEDFEVAGRWQAVTADVSDLVAAGTPRTLEIEARLDGARTSWFHFDEISLTACTPR